MKILLCGMGNTERGDDGFGPYVVHHLSSLQNIKTLDCGMYIENHLNTIVSAKPDLIVLLDATKGVDDQAMIVKNKHIVEDQALSISTHHLPFSAVYEYIQTQSQAEIWLLAVPALSYTAFSDSVKHIAQNVIKAMVFLDSQAKIDIINVYEILSSTLR